MIVVNKFETYDEVENYLRETKKKYTYVKQRYNPDVFITPKQGKTEFNLALEEDQALVWIVKIELRDEQHI